MDSKRNPIYRSGDHNFQCRYYEQCQKNALKNQWPFWTCSECDNRLMGTAVTLVKRKPKSIPTMQKFRFKFVSKKLIEPDSSSLVKTNVAIEHKNKRTKPSPFQFYNP